MKTKKTNKHSGYRYKNLSNDWPWGLSGFSIWLGHKFPGGEYGTGKFWNQQKNS